MERGTTAVERLEGGKTSIQQRKLDEASAILEHLSDRASLEPKSRARTPR